MEEEKKVEFEEVEVVTDEAKDEVTEKKPSKVKAWFSRHKIGLTKLAKGAALIGGGLVAGIMLAHKKAVAEAEELESGDWDPDYNYLPEAESEEEDSEVEENEEA